MNLIALLLIILQIIAILILVDFFSGFFHWIEDSYFTENIPLIGRFIIIPNIIHHHSPRHFTKSPFWHRNLVTAILCSIIFTFISLLFGATWQVGLFCLVGAFCNEFHCWAHRTQKENGPIISLLHSCSIIQTPSHHSTHHTNPKARAYCVLTNFLNPILDWVEFWRKLEDIVAFIFRIRPRPDQSLSAEQGAAANP